MAEIRVINVRKRFKGTKALDGVNLTAPDGMITAVLGPSGSGKTTLLRVIAGLETPDGGRVYFDGKDVTDTPASGRGVGMVFQDLALFPHMTVLENVSFGLEARGMSEREAEARAREVLEMLRLEGLEHRYPHQLSGGQQQRVAIARALAPDPKILLLDEPFGSLDAKLREELLWEMRRLKEESGFTAIHVTHDQSEAMAIADRLAVMNEGKIVREGGVEEVVGDPQTVFVASFLGANVVELVEVAPGIYGADRLMVRYEEGLGKLRIGFYPEDVRLGEGLLVVVEAVSKWRSGYRVKVRSEFSEGEMEVWLPKVPGRKFEIEVRRWFPLSDTPPQTLP
ncbi:MAG: ABC transporter ATP-binding protein [Candidatus Korarchaeota archaeon]|nr:ABC transporter ATP-binding protein [Candidatus Korarchaeota archaeon]